MTALHRAVHVGYGLIKARGTMWTRGLDTFCLQQGQKDQMVIVRFSKEVLRRGGRKAMNAAGRALKAKDVFYRGELPSILLGAKRIHRIDLVADLFVIFEKPLLFLKQCGYLVIISVL